MNNYKDIIKNNDLEVNKVTIKGQATIIDTPLGQFVLKKNNNTDIYDYLLSKGFNHFPKIYDKDENSIMFEYVEDINYDIEERIVDFSKILAIMHNKTMYEINVTIDDYKIIYEDIKSKINDLIYYYNKLTNEIESKEYMSPCEYFIIRNISIIFSALDYSIYRLDEWFNLVKNNNKKRISTIYNNVDINNFIKNKKYSYLLSLDKCERNSPIFDVYSIYKKYNNKCNFSSVLTNYEKVNPLTKDEKILLFILISIPDKILINNSISYIKKVKESIERSYKVIDILNSEEEKARSTHESEND